MSESDVIDVAKRVVINKEARKIVIQRKPKIVSTTLLTEENSHDKMTNELLQEPPVEKKPKLSSSDVHSTSEPEPATVQNKLSALERLKSLNFSVPKSAVNPFSLAAPTKSNSLELPRQQIETEKSKKSLDIRPNLPSKQIPVEKKLDTKPKSLFDGDSLLHPSSNFSKQQSFNSNFTSIPPRNNAKHHPREEVRKPNFNEFIPRSVPSPPIFDAGPPGGFRSRFPPPSYPERNFSPFGPPSRQTVSCSPPIFFKPEDVWINPICVQKDHLEREKLDNLQITEFDVNNLSCIGLKNTIEYLLEIENELVCQSAHLVAQINCVRRAFELCPKVSPRIVERIKSKRKVIKKETLVKTEKEKTIPSAISEENFVKALCKAINDQAEERKKCMVFSPSFAETQQQQQSGGEFDYMAMAKIFFAGMASALLEKTKNSNS